MRKSMNMRRRKKVGSWFFILIGFKFKPFKALFWTCMGVFGYNYYLNLFSDLPEENLGMRIWKLTSNYRVYCSNF